jgi:hypothetical protein
MQLERKAVSAEPGMAPHGAGTSERDLNMSFDHLLKFEATQCTCNEDKKSVDLREITIACLWLSQD